MAAGTYSTILAAGGNTGSLFLPLKHGMLAPSQRSGFERTLFVVKEYADECPFPTLA